MNVWDITGVSAGTGTCGGANPLAVTGLTLGAMNICGIPGVCGGVNPARVTGVPDGVMNIWFGSAGLCGGANIAALPAPPTRLLFRLAAARPLLSGLSGRLGGRLSEGVPILGVRVFRTRSTEARTISAGTSLSCTGAPVTTVLGDIIGEGSGEPTRNSG